MQDAPDGISNPLHMTLRDRTATVHACANSCRGQGITAIRERIA
jgi:hypothetical protein